MNFRLGGVVCQFDSPGTDMFGEYGDLSDRWLAIPEEKPVRRRDRLDHGVSPLERIVPLRDYQIEAIEAIHAEEAARQLLVLPTGTGKTIVFSDVIRERLPERALILAHRDELIGQAVKKFAMVSGGAVDIGVVKAERNQPNATVVVGSVQTLINAKRRAQLGDFSTIVVDEAHHATAVSYRKILTDLGAFDGDGPLTLGVTATPDRSDKVGLSHVFEKIVYEAKLIDMIARGYLCDLQARRVVLPIDFKKVRSTFGKHGDYKMADVEEQMIASDAELVLVDAIVSEAEDRKKILIFTPTVLIAHRLSWLLTEAGFPCGVVDADTPQDERRETLERFSNGDLRAVANMGILTEGYDNESVDCVVVARPTKSRSLYAQMVGRGTRTAPGKTNCLILDVVGVSEAHKLQCLATLVGLKLQPPQQKYEPTGDEQPQLSILEFLQQYGGTTGTGERLTKNIELFDTSWAQWIPDAGRWILQAKEEMFVLQPSVDGTWRVTSRHREFGESVLAEGMDLGYAQGIAEHRAREVAEVLSMKGAKWRTQPVTDKQYDTLLKFRLNPLDYRNKGEASDAITIAIANMRNRG